MGPRLAPGEQVLYTGFVESTGPPITLLFYVLLVSCCGIGLVLLAHAYLYGGLGPYYVVVTNLRFHLFWTRRVENVVRRYEVIPLEHVRALRVRRRARRATMDLVLTNGATLYWSAWRIQRRVSGQSAFLDEMPIRLRAARGLPG